MDDALKDMFDKKLAEIVSDADMPELRTQIPLTLANSLPMESDTAWWDFRAWVIAHDCDKVGHDLSMGQRLAYRSN